MEKQDFEELEKQIEPEKELLESEKKEIFLNEYKELCEKHGYMLYSILELVKVDKINEKFSNDRKSTSR